MDDVRGDLLGLSQFVTNRLLKQLALSGDNLKQFRKINK